MEIRRNALGGALASAVAFGALPLGAASPPSPPTVAYTIAATLDPDSKVLDGRQTLRWRNPSKEPVGELRFHMYLNAFKNHRSTFMQESGGRLRSEFEKAKPGDWGWIDLISMRTSGGEDLAPRARFVHPDGNGTDDQTVLAVSLPAPVAPGGEIALEIAFRAKFPKLVARTGFVRDYFLVAQWYPKLGVYEPAGTRGRKAGGWNCHAFHGESEFYADFGSFDVSVTVPSRFVVGATGRRVSRTDESGRTTHRYVQENVHDFAWAADPRFRDVEFSFDPSRDVPAGWTARAAKQLGLRESELALPPVSVRLLLQPGHEGARGRYVRSIREAIAFFGLWYGPYPYGVLTVVDPPDDGMDSGGMEYPTFYTGGLANAFLTRWPFQEVRLIEVVNIHEFGHQYWYGMVASNEFEEPWLDEGLTDDSEAVAMELAYGPRDFARLPGGIGLDSISYRRLLVNGRPALDPIARCSWCFASSSSYAVNSYPKVGLLMAQLRNDLGEDVVARALRTYFQEWSFRHPGTNDFFDVFERVSGRDLATYRRNLVEGTARLDWQVVTARSGEAARDTGVFDRPEGRVTLHHGDPVPPGQDAAPKSRAPGKTLYETLVLFANTGEWAHGAKARMVFEDGTVVDRELPASARWVRYQIRYGSRLALAVADPDRRNVWDANHLNDSRVVGPGRGAAATGSRRAAVRSFGWMSYLVGLWSQLAWALT